MSRVAPACDGSDAARDAKKGDKGASPDDEEEGVKGVTEMDESIAVKIGRGSNGMSEQLRAVLATVANNLGKKSFWTCIEEKKTQKFVR